MHPRNAVDQARRRLRDDRQQPAFVRPDSSEARTSTAAGPRRLPNSAHSRPRPDDAGDDAGSGSTGGGAS